MGEWRPPFRRLDDVEAFAVDATSVQVTFRHMSPTVEIAADDKRLVHSNGDGAGAVTLSGLSPDSSYSMSIADAGVESELVVHTRRDLGSVRGRFATISDVHLGIPGFGLTKRIRDGGPEPYPLRCAMAAVREAAAWGAELLIIKGDLTDHGTIPSWDEAIELLSTISIPVMFAPGNHDVDDRSELTAEEAAVRIGVPFESVQIRDVAGLRIVLADTSIPGKGTGTLKRTRDELLDAVAVDRPVFLALHHNVQRLKFSYFWPPGISSSDAMPVIAELHAANPNLFISSGHTHRNRRHWIGPDRSVLFTEVGSTSDYPGVWAGYEVTDSALRQTVRRIAEPDCLEWTERTRRAVGGIWPMWSQGALDDRCIDLKFR